MQQTVLLRTSRALFIFSLAKAKVQQRSNVTAAGCDSLYSSKFPNVFVSAKCICTNSQICLSKLSNIFVANVKCDQQLVVVMLRAALLPGSLHCLLTPDCCSSPPTAQPYLPQTAAAAQTTPVSCSVTSTNLSLQSDSREW